MNWQYDQTAVPDPLVFPGFVYLITNTVTGRMYIGKKKTCIQKAKKFAKESDWKSYWGSNKELLEDIKTLGEDKFTREVLHWCVSPGEQSWWELVELVERKAMTAKLPDGTNAYYNGNILMSFNSKVVQGYQDPTRRAKYLSDHDKQRKAVAK